MHGVVGRLGLGFVCGSSRVRLGVVGHLGVIQQLGLLPVIVI